MTTITRILITIIALAAGTVCSAEAAETVAVATKINAGQVSATGGRVYLSTVNINGGTVNGTISVISRATVDSVTVKNTGRVYVSSVDLHHTQLNNLQYASTATVDGRITVAEGQLMNIASGSINGVEIGGDVTLDLSAAVHGDIETGNEGTVMIGGVRIGDTIDIDNQTHGDDAPGPVLPPADIDILPRPTALDYAHLSRCAYADKKCALPEGWEQIAPADLPDYEIFVSESIFNDGRSGFHAAIFYNQSMGEWVLGFEGTGSRRDWKTNVFQALAPELIDRQYLLAGILSRLLNEQVSRKGDNLTFTGHSLGGGLASMASMTTGKPATTFNAAGLRKATALNGQYSGTSKQEIIQNWKNQNNLIDAYYVKGDELHDLQEKFIPSLKNAIGRHISLENPGRFDICPEHGIDVVIQSLTAPNKNRAVL